MHGSNTLNLVFGSRNFIFPSNQMIIPLLNPDIVKSLQSKNEYKVKSNVTMEVFESFFNYLIFKKIPNLNFANISQYEQLSEEFDYMKDLIKIFRITTNEKDIIFTSFQKQKLSEKFQKKTNNLQSKSINFKKNINSLFNMKRYETFSQLIQNEANIINICLNLESELVDEHTKEEFEENGLVYYLNEEEKTACLYKITTKNKNIHIPGSIVYKSQKYLVTKIMDWAFEYNYDCESLKFDENPTKSFILNDGYHLYNLESLTIPSDIEVFNPYWCDRMNKLKNITIIQKKNQNIIFYDNNFIFGKSDIKSDTFDILYFARRDIEFVTIPSYIKRIAPYAFDECKKIKKFEFEPNSQLTLIDDYAFIGSSILELNIPPKVKQIGKCAFISFCKIKKITFSNDSEIEIIDDHAFDCSSLETITIPSSIKKIGKKWFYVKLQNVNIIKNKVENIKWFNNEFILGKTNINSDVFDIILYANKQIEKAIIPSFIRIIDPCAFSGNKKLKSIEFSSNSHIKMIRNNAFSKTNLERISIPSSVIKIGRYCFFQCDHLKVVEFTNDSQLKTIGCSAFSYCPIEYIKIPSQVKLIESCAFRNCWKLKLVEFYENSELRKIDNETFQNSSIKTISIPSHVIEIGERAFEYTEHLINVEFSDDSELEIIGKYAFSVSSIRRIKIPAHVTKIKKHTFFGCTSLISVEFDEKSELKIIGDCAFVHCNFETISIPNNVIEIKKNAFYNSQKLKYVDFNENSKLEVIGESAFCETSIKSMIIPSSSKKIDRTAFDKINKPQIVEIDGIENPLFLLPNFQNTFYSSQ